MQIKKYIVFLMLVIIISTNKVQALNIEKNIKNFDYKLSNAILIIDSNTDIDCSIFGDIDDAGEYITLFGKEVEVRPPSIRYLVNKVLTYVRIIVPIIIIVLGSIDFAKAALASKEDEMKKAQKTFVKRVIAGVIVFFVPEIVNVIMSLAEIVWEGLGYNRCPLK